MYKDIRGYVQTCDACERKGNLRTNNVLHLIKSKASFQRIGIDIVGLLTIIKKGNRYIVTAMDYFTKWPIAKAIKEGCEALRFLVSQRKINGLESVARNIEKVRT